MIKDVISLLLLIGLASGQGAGNALDFDGSDDHVVIPSSIAVANDNNFTIEIWAYWRASNHDALYAEGNTSSNNPMLSIIPRTQDSGGIELVCRDLSATGLVAQPTTGVVTTTKWTHVAVARLSSTNIKVYIDGVQTDDLTFSAPSSWTVNAIRLGVRQRISAESRYDGDIDEVRIWDDTRTQSEIQKNMHKELAGDESNLVAYYKMSDGSGSSLTDNSSNSNTGTLSGMDNSDWVTSYAPIGDLNSSYVTDVEAIWSISGTSASDASDGLTMTVSGALSTVNFAVFGNNNTSSTSTSDIGAVGSTLRTGRIWQVDESGTVTATVMIDMSDATGVSGNTGTASNYRLLYRSGTSGDFSSTATGSSISGDVITFNSISLQDGYYALGAQSDASLPVELTSFEVLDTRANGITLHWITESEINNLGFILDRRTPTIDWIEIASFVTDTELQGQGSVSHQTVYTYTDNTVTDDETYDYRIADVDYDGNKEYHSLQLMGISPASIPITYVLHQNYPNPFNPITTLSYDLPEDAMVNITIYDMVGRQIRTPINNQQTVGYRSVQWNGTNNLGEPVSAGLYLYTIQAGEFVQTKKMVILK